MPKERKRSTVQLLSTCIASAPPSLHFSANGPANGPASVLRSRFVFFCFLSSCKRISLGSMIELVHPFAPLCVGRFPCAHTPFFGACFSFPLLCHSILRYFDFVPAARLIFVIAFLAARLDKIDSSARQFECVATEHLYVCLFSKLY